MVGSKGKRNRAGRKSIKASAFTLIELLVVVSIIALLISILLPSLKKARDQAKQAKCLANLTGISKGCTTYAVDDEGNNVFPISPTFGKVTAHSDGVKLVPRWFEWGGRSGKAGFEYPDYITQSPWGIADGLNSYNRPLNKLLYKAGMKKLRTSDPETEVDKDFKLDLGIYACPADIGYTASGYTDVGYGMDQLRASGRSCYEHYGNSYTGASFIVCLTSGSGCIQDLPIYSTAPFYRPLSRIPNGANTILFYEGNASRAYRGYDRSKGQPLTNPTGEFALDTEKVKGWHGRDWFFTACFVDGHSGVIKMKGMIVPPPDLGSTYPMPPGSQRPYDYWSGITIRGNGWQLDSLPAPTVELPFTAGETGF